MIDPDPGSAADLAEALRRIGGDRALLRELADIFLEDLPDRVAELRDAVRASDATRVERVAHTMGGSLAALEAGTARRLAAGLTALARSGRLGEAPAALARLEAELERVAALFAESRGDAGGDAV